MRIVLLLFLAVLLGLAQPTITLGPAIHVITHSQASVYFETGASASPVCQWGTSTGVYPNVLIVDTSNQTQHGMYMSGMPAGTTIFAKCGATTSSTCTVGVDCTLSSEFTFQTASITAHPEPLTPPDESWSVGIHAVPTTVNTTEWNGGGAWASGSAGGRYVTMDSNCRLASDTTKTLQDVFTATEALSSSENLKVRIPPGAVCYGKFVHNARASHTGWLIIEPAVSAAQLPPEGVRTSANWGHTQYTIRANAHWAARAGLTFMDGRCRAGHGDQNHAFLGRFDSALATGFPLYLCTSDVTSIPSAQTITAYNPTGQVFTVVGHGLASGNLAEISGTGLSLDSTSTAWHIVRLSADTFTVANVTITGTCTGCGTTAIVQEIGNYSTPADLGILSSGSGPPVGSGSADGNWYLDTSVANHLGGYFWSTRDNRWHNVHFRNTTTSTEHNAVQFVGAANKIRYVGARIDRWPGWNSNLSSYGISYNVNYVAQLANVAYDAEDVIFDRCDFDGLGYPSRTGQAINMNGKRNALLNSRFLNIDRWFTSNSIPGLADPESITINVVGKGPGRIENNYIESAGIALFFPDNTTSWIDSPNDYVVRRNTFFKDFAHMKGHSQNTNDHYFGNRHAIECKKCERNLIIGNVFNQNFASTNQGAIIGMTTQVSSNGALETLTITDAEDGVLTMSAALPTSFVDSYEHYLIKISGNTDSAHNGLWKIDTASGSTVTLLNPPTGTGTGGTLTLVGLPWRIRDVRIAYNTFRKIPYFFKASSWHTSNTEFIESIGMGGNYQIDNNLIIDINAGTVASGGYCATLGVPGCPTGQLANLYDVARGVQDLTFRNNTINGVTTSGSHGKHMNFIDGSQAVGVTGRNDLLTVENNLVVADADTTTGQINSDVGTDALDIVFEINGTPSWSFNGNVLAAANSSANKPVGSPANVYPATNDIKWMNTAGEDYRLKWDSPYRGRGANIEELRAQQGEVRNVRVRNINTSPVLSYQAPDSGACTVESGTSATWGTYTTRTNDGGGSRWRDTAVTLSGNTDYIRLLCAVEQWVCTESGSVFECVKQ